MTTKTKQKVCADLFCGAGGTSTGLIKAITALGYDYDLLAINHWDVAIATHTLNHEKVKHLCQNLDKVDPLELVPGGRLDILVASPECTHHSNARGGKPRSDQKRADAWLLMRWLEKLYVKNLLIENVKEFMSWGPLGANGQPLKSKRGMYFKQFIDTLEINYRVEHRIINCANFGDPTTRERFFLLARRHNHPHFVWPSYTHASPAELEKRAQNPDLFGEKRATLKPWRTARQDVIDWDIESRSIFDRKKPLSPNTMARIFAGLRKHSGLAIVMSTSGREGHMNPRSVDEPLRTVMPNSRLNMFEAKAAPFVMKLSHTKSKHNYSRPVTEPLTTITGLQEHCIVEAHIGNLDPFVVNLKGKSTSRSIDEPTVAQTTKPHQYLVESDLILNIRGGNDGYTRSSSVNDPLPALTASPPTALVETKLRPFIITNNHGTDKKSKDGGHGRRTHSVDKPLPAVTTIDAWSVIEPYMVQFFGERAGQEPRTRSVDDPAWTVTAQGRMALVEPHIVAYHGNHRGKKDGSRRSQSVDAPLPTQDTSNRFGVVEGDVVQGDSFLLKSYTGSDSAPLDKPVPTITAFEHLGLVENDVVRGDPHLMKFYGTAKSGGSVDEPLDTVTAKDRFALVEPTLVRVKSEGKKDVVGLYIPALGIIVDIRFRMLQPPELARAMSFPKNYQFSGNREDRVAQIGNAVPCRTAEALCKALLDEPVRVKRTRVKLSRCF